MQIKTDRSEFLTYLEDASLFPGGSADKIFFPESSHEVIQVITECVAKSIPITISGRGTGLTGGRVPQKGVILSLDRLLNEKPPIDTMVDQVLNCEQDGSVGSIYILKEGNQLSAWVSAGLSLEVFQKQILKLGLYYPPNPTETKASLGGTLATNASGSRSYKYGATRCWVNAIRLLTMDGQIRDIRRGQYKSHKGLMHDFLEKGRSISIPTYTMPNCKHVAGYYVKEDLDVVDLLIGSEGTLGIITAMELILISRPAHILSGISFFKSEKEAWQVVQKIRENHFDLSAIEYFDCFSLEKLRRKKHKVSIPVYAQSALYWEYETDHSITQDEIWNALEQSMQTEFSPKNFIEQWFIFLKQFLVLDDMSFYIDDLEPHRYFRHLLPLVINEEIIANKRHSGQPIHKVATDFACPDQYFLEMMTYYESALKHSGLEYVMFGHIGNNHLHVNLLPKNLVEFKKAWQVYTEMAVRIVQWQGTISAEHGIGKLKKHLLKLLYLETAIQEMRLLKRQMDPQGLLGQGNIFDL